MLKTNKFNFDLNRPTRHSKRKLTSAEAMLKVVRRQLKDATSAVTTGK